MENNVVRVGLPVKINSENKGELEKILSEANIPDNVSEIVLDASDLEYISSAGLRTLLAFRQKHEQPICIADVKPEVYDIFDMTGFSDLFRIEKALRFVDTDGLDELGRGMYGAVYRIDEERILKVFYGVNSRQKLEEILHNVRTAFVKGIPTIMPFDTVKTNAGIGMVFELLSSDSLADMIHKEPARAEEYVRNMAELAKKMATTEFEPGTINERAEMLKFELKEAAFLFTEEEINELIKYVDAVPARNTAVHGDFHARNVYMLDGKALLIDMDDFCLGHPIWDIACLYRVYPYMIGLDAETSGQLFGLPPQVSYPDFYYQVMHLTIDEGTDLWQLFLKYYFEGHSEDDVNAILETAKFYSDFMVIRFLIDQCRKCGDQPDILSVKLGLIRRILSDMRTKDLGNLIQNLECGCFASKA